MPGFDGIWGRSVAQTTTTVAERVFGTATVSIQSSVVNQAQTATCCNLCAQTYPRIPFKRNGCSWSGHTLSSHLDTFFCANTGG
jgi:hypothetical protein